MKPNLPCISILLILVAFYMCNFSHAGNQQASAHKETSQREVVLTNIGDGPLHWAGITVDKSANVMYGISTDISQSILNTIDMESGAATVIGPTDIPGAIDCAIDGLAFPGGGPCWASINPAAGTIAPGGTQVVNVTLDGNYIPPQKELDLTGNVILSTDPDVGSPVVTPQMHISGEFSGVLEGIVSHGGAPVDSVTVTATRRGSQVYTYTMMTGIDGVYSFPDVVYGDYDLTAVKPGYNTFVSAGPVVITGGLTSVYEIAMTIPEMVIDPPEINEFVLFGTIFTQPVTITNAGDRTLNWSAGVTILNKQKVAVPASDGNFPRGDAPVSIGRAPMAKSSVPGSQQEAKGTTAYAFNVNPNQTFISFNTDDPGNQNVINTIDYLPCGGTFDIMNSDFMYVIDYNYNTLIKVGIAAGEVTNVGYCQPYGGQNWSGITVDKHTNIMYGISTNTSESCLYCIDKETGETTLIGPTGIPGAIDLTIDGTGQMYSFDIVTDAAYRIDKETGASTLIGSLGYDANFVQGMGWDPEDDLIYITGYNNATQAGELRILDRETGNTALVGDLGGEVDALAFPGGGFTWLSIDQHSGSLPAGASDTVMVSLDATFVPPSDVVHHGTITFSSDPNVGAVAVPVTMSTEDWYGSLEGYVTHGGSGVPDAVVSVFRGGINWFTVNTDLNGHYLIGNLLPFNYIVTVEAAGYNPYYIVDVFISPGDTTILNISLTAPVVHITPPELIVSLHAGESAIRMLTIANTGDGPVTVDGSVNINNKKVISIPHGNGEFPHGTAAPSIERAPESKPAGNPASEIRRGITGYAFNIYPDHTFFSFDSDDPGTVNIISTIDYVPAGATFDATNTGFIYFLDYYTRFLRKVDVATGNVTDIGLANPYGDQYWTGITVDKSTNILYGISTDYSESYIYTIDAETGNATVIGATGIPCAIDVAVDGSGQMYSFDIVGDNAYAIEKETGISTLIGSIGFDANYAQGMAWEPVTDIIYLAAFNNATLNGELRILDRGTGNTTFVGGMGGEVDGLTFTGGVPAEWLYTVTDPFSVPAGSSVEVPVYFYATDLEPGTYTGYITFHSDPNVGTVVIPVMLIVSPVPTLSISVVSNVLPGPVSVPVHAEEIVNMGSFQFTIDYDASKLVYTGTSNWYPGVTDVLTGNPSAGKLTFVWAASTTGITISDGNFFNIDFIYNGSLNGAPIAWSDNPTQREFADWDGNIFVPTYYNGYVIGDPIGLSENRSQVFRIYPNPASNIVTVKSDFSFTRIEVFSSLGQTVYNEGYPGEKEVQLNVSALPAGIYMVKVYSEKGVGMVKVAVRR